jgi:hypothetical protein
MWLFIKEGENVDDDDEESDSRLFSTIDFWKKNSHENEVRSSIENCYFFFENNS